MAPSDSPRNDAEPASETEPEPAWTPVDDAGAGSFPASDPPPFGNLHAGTPGAHPDPSPGHGGEA